MFYVDVRNIDTYTFYYNVNKEVNRHVQEVLGKEVLDKLPNVKNNSSLQFGDYARMGNYNPRTGQVDIEEHFEMQGIAATVARALAEEIVERAKYYCPVDSGLLRDSFVIEDLGDGKCRIYNTCPYAWYVHEFTWKQHNYPTCAKFLTLAIQEIETKYGFGWYSGG